MEQQALFAEMSLFNWNLYIKRTDDLLNTLTDEQLAGEISPGRNTGVYLTGHLFTYHDAMCDILELGERKYASLDNAFLKNPDKSGINFPSIATLREYWTETNNRLQKYFANMQTAEWFSKHKNISAEDFAKEPRRNKLSILINRTHHLSYHYGQLILLKSK